MGRATVAALVSAQIAIAVLQVRVASVVVTRLLELARENMGFEVDRSVTVGVDPTPEMQGAAAAATLRRVRDALASLPGVEAVGTVNHPPLVDRAALAPIAFPGMAQNGPFGPMAILRLVDGGYFGALQPRIIAGRMIDSTDVRDQARVAVVNESFVKSFAASGALIGSAITVTPPPEAGPNTSALEVRVVDVVADAHDWGALRDPLPVVHLPSGTVPWPTAAFIVRGSVSPASLVPSIRRVIADVDPTLPVPFLETTRAMAEGYTRTYRATGTVVSLFAATSLLLALIAVTSIAWSGVSERWQDAAIAMSLGATPMRTVATLVRANVPAILVGTGVGVFATRLAMPGLRGLLNMPDRDSLALAAAVSLGIAGTCAACALLPTLRVFRIRLSTVLR